MPAAVREAPSAATPPRLPVLTSLTSRVSDGLDLLSDLLVISFAAFTVLYHLALLVHLHTNLLMALWVGCSIALAWALHRSGRPEPAPAEPADRPRGGRLGEVSIPIAVLSGLLALLTGVVHAWAWWPTWALAAASAVAALLAVRRCVPSRSHGSRPSAPVGGTWLALGGALGLGVFSVFTLRPDPDDTFYVNRAVWVAEHGTISSRDTMFSSDHLPAIRGAGVPVGSIETFQGAVAHILHIAGGTAAYLLTPPVGTFFAVWALWRLIRSWAPRRLALCLAVAVIYLIWSASDGGNLGVFFLARMQQGKVIFVAMLVPLLYVYLTRWSEHPTRRQGLLLLAAGVAAIGFTSSATFVVPLICAVVALPIALRRDYRVALGAFLPFVYPALVGIVVHFSYASVNPNGVFHSPENTFNGLFGTSWFGLISILGAFLALWLVRPGAPRLAAAGVPILLVLVLAPGVLTLLADLTGAKAVLWRTMWLAPLPALVGMAASVRLPVRWRWAAPLPAAVLIVAILAAGSPLWAPQRNVTITSRPTWRYSASQLQQAREIIRADTRGGTVLAPEPTMRAMTITTTRVHAISPLQGYTALLDEPAAQHAARILLLRVIVDGFALPEPATLRTALDLLDVSMVCLPASSHARRDVVERAGYDQLNRIYHLNCFSPTTT